MDNFRQKLNHWLLPVFTILFIVQILLFPLATGFTYAGKSESPDHVLTYFKGKLTWDSGVNIRPDGTAEMEIFFPEYDDSIKSGNGDDVIAPGSGEDYFLRLRNAAGGPVTYYAVLYAIKSDPDIPLDAWLTGDADLTPSDVYYLPEGVSDSDVISAFRGTVPGGRLQDFDVEWAWKFFESHEQDAADTALGNKTPLDTMTLGLYLVIEDENTYHETPVVPENPKTGDDSPVAMYLTLMAISFLVLVLLIADRIREYRCEKAK